MVVLHFAFQASTVFYKSYLLLLHLQDSISRATEGHIISDLRSSLSEICDVLSSLDIAIGFLSSSGGQTGMQLKWYLHGVLKLPRERGLRSPTVSRGSKLSMGPKHIHVITSDLEIRKKKVTSSSGEQPINKLSSVFMSLCKESRWVFISIYMM